MTFEGNPNDTVGLRPGTDLASVSIGSLSVVRPRVFAQRVNPYTTTLRGKGNFQHLGRIICDFLGIYLSPPFHKKRKDPHPSVP